MTVNTYRLLFSLGISAIILWHLHNEKEELFSSGPHVYMYGCILPLYVGGLSLAMLVFYGWDTAVNVLLTLCFDTFLVISLYYGVLIFLIPVLRRRISARVCAALWMIPNYLYLLQRNNMLLEQDHPLLLVQLPGNWAVIALGIWFCGFLGILGWKIWEHLRFRRYLLADCEEVTEDMVQKIWAEEKERCLELSSGVRLVRSGNAATPLSIGLQERSTYVVLPVRDYTPEELSLIFRHELTHIQRRDGFSKLFLVICTAMCWFNPLMWIAMRRSAEDMELCCDEAVLKDADHGRRREYANLILNTAADSRGFTSCLSATAGSLRYRLKNVVHPTRKLWGGLLASVLFLILAMSCGHISLAYGDQPGSKVIYSGNPAESTRIRSIHLKNSQDYATLRCRDEKALHSYLSSLKLRPMTGDYTISEFDNYFQYHFSSPDFHSFLEIKDQYLLYTPLGQNVRQRGIYYIPDGIDWAYLDSLMEYVPGLWLDFTADGESVSARATAYRITKWENAESSLLRNAAEVTDLDMQLGEDTTEVTLRFTNPVASEYRVKIESWNRSRSQTFLASQLEKENTIPLLEPCGHYTIYTEVSGVGNIVYEVEFRFDIYDVAAWEAEYNG